MKRIVSIVLLVALCFGIIACGSNGATQPPPTQPSPSPTPETTPPIAPAPEIPATPPTEGGEIVVDQGLLTTTITIPAEFFAHAENFDIDEYAQETGATEAILNEDGSVTLRMSRLRHAELLRETEEVILDYINTFVSGESMIRIESFEHTRDFRTLSLYVEREYYESFFFGFSMMLVGVAIGMYQAFLGDGIHSEIRIYDNTTRALVDTMIFPDDLI